MMHLKRMPSPLHRRIYYANQTAAITVSFSILFTDVAINSL